MVFSRDAMTRGCRSSFRQGQHTLGHTAETVSGKRPSISGPIFAPRVECAASAPCPNGWTDCRRAASHRPRTSESGEESPIGSSICRPRQVERWLA
jgi:hypothetical protein